MLSSITPLGERGRGRDWFKTTTAYVVSTVLAAVAVGYVLGLVGEFLAIAHPTIGGIVLASACVIGALADVGAMGMSLPTGSRQVDRRWLERYRGWVYGTGYGLQLGAGFATIVTTSAIYVMFAAELLGGRAWAGALIGFVFGVCRSASIYLAIGVRTPAALMTFHKRLSNAEPLVNSALTRVQLLFGSALVAGLIAFAATGSD